jgi:hypothetical protein
LDDVGLDFDCGCDCSKDLGLLITLYLVSRPPDWLTVCVSKPPILNSQKITTSASRDFNRMPRVMEPDGQLGFLILLADSLGLYTLLQSNSNFVIGRRILFALH